MTEAHYPAVQIKRVIGSGCFGVVLQGTYKNSNKKCALKRIQKVSNQLSRQMQILKMIKDLDNVVQMQHLFYTKDETGTKLVQNIVFQFVQSNLQNLIEKHIKQRSSINQLFIKKCMYQLLNGLKNIHHYKIAHRDLKPENVLLSEEGQIKICDFGSSKVIHEQGKNTPYIVSRYYRAPELILCVTKYSTAIDVWAAGCILAELYLLMPFFKGKTEGEQMFQIAKRMGGLSNSDKNYFKKLVPYDIGMLNAFDNSEPDNLSSVFNKSNDRQNLVSILKSMLKYNPQQRISAQDALNHPYFNELNEKPQPDSQ